MQHTITTIYCLCDDFLQAMNYPTDAQARLSNAEVMLIPLVGACYCLKRQDLIEWGKAS